MVVDQRLTIDEIEQLLKREDDIPLQILPDGTVLRGGEPVARSTVLTHGHDLDGHY